MTTTMRGWSRADSAQFGARELGGLLGENGTDRDTRELLIVVRARWARQLAAAKQRQAGR